jgi:DNA-binding MarR family transcriptional regulator
VNSTVTVTSLPDPQQNVEKPAQIQQPAPPAVSEFLSAFDTFVQAVRRARGAPAHDGERGLTLSQYGLLQPLANCEVARVRELADQAGIAAPTATRILDALERRGIVQRRRSVGDRRGVSVTLTPHGREILCDEDEWMRERQREFFATLPSIERELIPDLLNRLAGLIDELAVGPERRDAAA